MRSLLRSRVGLFMAAGIAAAGIAAGLIVVIVVGFGGSKKPRIGTPVTTGASSSVTKPPGTTVPEPSIAVGGGAETAELLRGIPQNLNVLGHPEAPVTMVEFADLQCPFCRDFALDALPAIVRQYVRPGKVKLVFIGIAFIGPDSERALRATYAAGLQNRLWTLLNLLYHNQGPENSGWVTDDLLRAAGQAIPGLDVDAMMAARQARDVDNAIAATSRQASSARVDRTPTFFAGPSGGTLQQIRVSGLRPEAFRPALDAALE